MRKRARRGEPRMEDHELYRTWANMKNRCFNDRSPDYRYYGGRGITMCTEWREDFWAFAEDMGDRPTPEHTVDRIDGDGNYEPGNVRWATRTEQARNRSANVLDLEKARAIRAEYTGARGDLPRLALKYGVSKSTVFNIVNDISWKEAS